MNCRKAQRLINELLDGEIADKDRQELQAHLEKCDRCRELYQDLKSIKEKMVPAEAGGPSDRVWENLKNRLQSEVLPRLQAEASRPTEESSRRKITDLFRLPVPVFRYAAASLVFLAFVFGAFYLGRHYQKPGQPDLQVASQNQTLQKLQEAEFYYKKAVQSLTQVLESPGNELPPEMTEILQANLGLLDRTIDLARQAVNDQPDNWQAREFLISAYDSKLNFLNGLLETRNSLNQPGLGKI